MLPVLFRASLEGALVVGGIWLLMRVLPTLTPATRTLLWWLAAAKFLVAIAWIPPIHVPILPTPDVLPDLGVSSTLAVLPASVEPMAVPIDPTAATPGARFDARSLTTAVIGLWTLGFAASLWRALRRLQQTRHVVQRAVPAGPEVQAAAFDMAARVGLREAPAVCLSNEVDSPLVVGLSRPVVVLPDRFLRLADEQQRMALCHELAHVRRRDLWLGCAPALAERVFFFHPLVRFAAREYAFWREAACDAHVLRALGAAPHEYGRLLLDLGIVRRRTGLAAAGAPWSFSNLKRRISMLDNLATPATPATQSIRGRVRAATVLAAAAATLLPLRLVASRESREPETVTPPAAVQRVETERQSKSELNYVLFWSDGTDENITMSGSRADVDRARQLRRPGERLLWFRQAGKEYVVRDPAALEEARVIWKPLGAIGLEQGIIGSKQAMIGSRQAEIGAKQGQIGAQQADIGARQAALGVQQGSLGVRESGASRTLAERKALEQERLRLDVEMRQLDDRMRILAAQMEELEQPMRELSQQMDALSKDMDVLSLRMERATHEAEAALRQLLERAIQTGAAEAVK